MLWCPLVGALAWNLRRVDPLTARTTLRLWHELHVAKSITHDFEDLLAPRGDEFYMAAVRHDEIRALAQCLGEDAVRVRALAHPPEQLEGPRVLLDLLRDSNATLEWASLKKQPRWYYEEVLRRF